MKKFMMLVFAALLIAPLMGAMAREEGMPQMQTMAMINDVMRSMAGTWTGRGTMRDMQTNQDVPFMDTFTARPALNNKFLMTECNAKPDVHGNVFQGRGYSTYNPAEKQYEMYWFDSMGFAGKFIGQKNGNVITYTHTGNDGMVMTLTMTIVNDNEHQMSLVGTMGDKVIPMMNVNYTRTSGMGTHEERGHMQGY